MRNSRLLWVASAALVLVHFPAYADMIAKSADGSLELALPNGWHDVKPDGPTTKIAATNGHGSRVVVRVYPKEDFKDAKAVANFSISKLKLSDDEGVKFEDIQVGGKPAVRASVLGTQASGMRAGYLVTVVDNDSTYVELMGRSDASTFAKETPALAAFGAALKTTATAAPPPAATPAPAAAAGSAAVKPPLPQPKN
jgi:hypothetical protein